MTKQSGGFQWIANDDDSPYGVRRASDGAVYQLPRINSSGSLVDGGGNAYLLTGILINGVIADGITDNADAFQAAATIANAAGLAVILPAGPIVISHTVVVDRLIGIPGKSKIILASDFTTTGFANQFCIINSSFGQSYNESTANEVLHYGYDIETTPHAGRSILGLANVRGGLIDRVNITANQYISGGKPVAIDALIDLYACVKNVTIRRCILSQLTGAYGTTKVSAGGGGCMWIRNLRSTGGTAELNVTEHNIVHSNVFNHYSSDEALAIYGVRGHTRYNEVHHNRFYGLDSVGAYHPVLVSCFPLNDGSGAGLGDTAAVYENTIHDNYINDRSFLYNVLKIGNSADPSNLCYGNKLARNTLHIWRSTDATYGPYATWVAAGSPSTDPNVASKAIYCFNGTLGTAYEGASSGNSSDGDMVYAQGGSQVNAAFAGWHNVNNPTARGNFYTGAEQCRAVTGGEFDVFGRAYYNCNQVTGGFANVNGTVASSYCVNYIDSAFAQSYTMTGVRFASAAGFVNLTAAVPATSMASFNGNIGSVANAAAAGIINNAHASTVVKAHLNSLSGSLSAPSSGTGTTTRTGNNWSGTTD